MAVPPPFVLNEDPGRVNDTQTPMITGVITALHLIALLFVIIRSYIRLVVLKSPGIQDALMAIAVVSCSLPCFCYLLFDNNYWLQIHTCSRCPKSDLHTKVTALVGTIILFMQVPYGLGKHADTVPRPDLVEFSKFSFIHTVVPLLGGMGFLKVAIALELMKYNGRLWRWYNITLWCLIGRFYRCSSRS